jgi:hypothetical protein
LENLLYLTANIAVMRNTVLAIVAVVLIVALAGTVLSQGKRAECLNMCRDYGDQCAQKAYQANAMCADDKVICDETQNMALRRCQADYDACRWNCDLPPF